MASKVCSDMSVVLAISLVIARRMKERRKKRNRVIWVKPWLSRRPEQGAYANLIAELQEEDNSGFNNFLRIDYSNFQELLELVTPYIRRQDTRFRECISPGERLAITLRFLATGETFQSLQYLYRVSRTAIGQIIPETCQALYLTLKTEYMKTPQTEEEWIAIATAYEDKWNFPNCIGSIDGKHINIRPPPNTGSTFYNYKHTFSMILMAIVDADYRFIYIDVGCNGRVSDGGVFDRCSLKHALDNQTLNIPPPKVLPNTNQPLPYVFVGDEAFPLTSQLMKPFPHRSLDREERIYNYRLSRARRVVENVFGILASRFRVFSQPIGIQSPDKIEAVVLGSCVLHNYLREKAPNKYTPPGSVDSEGENHQVIQGDWRQREINGILPLPHQPGPNLHQTAKDVRNSLKAYFNSIEGAVPWQWNVV